MNQLILNERMPYETEELRARADCRAASGSLGQIVRRPYGGRSGQTDRDQRRHVLQLAEAVRPNGRESRQAA